MKKRILSILLLCCMVLTMLPAPAFAADEEAYALPPDMGGLCEHHPEHDEACGYIPKTAEIPQENEVKIAVLSGTQETVTVESVQAMIDALPEAKNINDDNIEEVKIQFQAVVDAMNQLTVREQNELDISRYMKVSSVLYGPWRDFFNPIPGTDIEWMLSSNDDETLTLTIIGQGEMPDFEDADNQACPWTNSKYAIKRVIIREGVTNIGNYAFSGCAKLAEVHISKTVKKIGTAAFLNCSSLTQIDIPDCVNSVGSFAFVGCTGLKEVHTHWKSSDEINFGLFVFYEYGSSWPEDRIIYVPAGYKANFKSNPNGAWGSWNVQGENYTVSFDGGNASGSMEPVQTSGDYTLPDCSFTYETAVFEYWALENSDGKKAGDAGDVFPVTEDVTFYANWTLVIVIDPDPPIEVCIHEWGEWQSDSNEHWKKCSFCNVVDLGSRRAHDYSDDTDATCIICGYKRTITPPAPTLEPPTYSRQIYSGDFCQLAFSDEYLSGGKATADGETVDGVFTLNEEQGKYGYWNRGGGLVQVGPLALQVTFTPDDLLKYTTAECTVYVDVIPRKFRQANTSYIDNKKIGTAFEDLGLPNAFYFFAEADEPNHEGSGLNANVPGIIKWDDSNYDPNSYEEQTIYGTVNRAEFEKYYIVPEGADLKGVVKVTLQADPVETEITQPPVFRWKNGDFTLPDNTMFVDRIFEMGATGGGSANLADGVAKVKGTDTVVPGTFSFQEGTPGWFDELGENVVTVVFTPADQHGYRTAETTIKVNVIKNTFKRCEEPDPITEKKLGTTFAGLNLPEIVVVEAIDGLRVGMEVSWDESSYDAQSTAWQTIPGTLVFDANDEHRYQQPDPAVTAAIRVKLLGSEDAPAITTTTLPGGTVGTPYHHQLQATGGGFILWELFSGALPKGLTLKQTTGEISGTPTAEGTAQFTVQALNSVGNDKKELSITIANTPAVEHTVTVTNDGNGTGTATPSTAAAGTEITLTASPSENYHFKQWQVEAPAGLVIANDKFTMPDSDVEIKAVFEKDAPSAKDLVDPMIRIIPSKHGGYPTQGGTRTAADFFKPGEAPKGAKITAITPPASPSILDSISVDNDGLLSYAKNEADGEQLETDVYTVTITSDDYEPISAPLTVRQYLFAGFTSGWNLGPWVYGDTRTYKWKVLYPGENGTWSAVMREQGIFEVYEETVDTTSEPGVSHYTTKVRAIKAGQTFIDILYVSDTTAAWSPWSGPDIVAGGPVVVRGLTVTAGSATIAKGDALPTDLVSCTGLLDSEGRTDDRDTVLDNALSYRLLNANNEEITAEAARNTPGTYTVVPTAELKPGWDERYSLNRVNGTLTVEDKVEELFTVTVTSGGNGTVSASHVKAVADTEITLTATPDKGYHFKEWQVISGGVTIKDDKFTMPSANVEVKAIFEKDVPPAPTEFIVTFDGNGGTPSVDSMITTNQKLTSLPSASRSGSYSFDGWYTEKSGGTKITTDTVFHAGTTVYAHWTYTGGGSSNYSYYTIKATAGTGGSITPSGNVSVREGRDKTFTIPPDKGDTVSNVKIDGRSIGAVKSYTFENVKRAHTIEVSFTRVNAFVDVPSDSYFYETVMWAVENGVTTGISASRFDPDGICTRAQAVTFLWRAAGSPKPETRTMPFTDVPVGSYYYDAVLWAVENGITKGTSDTTFRPNDTCTRAQIVAFLWRSEKSPAAGTANPFADVKSTAYYAGAVLWAVREDITKGTTNTTFSPDADCTRAQIVTFLWRCKK